MARLPRISLPLKKMHTSGTIGRPSAFLAEDTGNTFGDHKHFDKAYIPLNSRAGLEKQDYTIMVGIAEIGKIGEFQN